MPMMSPPHPGRIVRQECLEPTGMTVTAAAKALGVTRQALNNLINERSGISPEMAIRLERTFGGSARSWLTQQMTYDLQKARERLQESA